MGMPQTRQRTRGMWLLTTAEAETASSKHFCASREEHGAKVGQDVELGEIDLIRACQKICIMDKIAA